MFKKKGNTTTMMQEFNCALNLKEMFLGDYFKV